MTAFSNIDSDSLQTYQDFSIGYDRPDSLTVRSKMIAVSYRSDEFEDITNDEKRYEKHIKEKMALQIANLILEEDLVLFTKQKDLTSYTTTYRARVFLANKDTVSVLLKSGIK